MFLSGMQRQNLALMKGLGRTARTRMSNGRVLIEPGV